VFLVFANVAIRFYSVFFGSGGWTIVAGAGRLPSAESILWHPLSQPHSHITISTLGACHVAP
jgi:hypothetical protein